jgi:hypothetical protein
LEAVLKLRQLLLDLSDPAFQSSLLSLLRGGVHHSWSFPLLSRVAHMQLPADGAGIDIQVVVLTQPAGVQHRQLFLLYSDFKGRVFEIIGPP